VVLEIQQRIDALRLPVGNSRQQSSASVQLGRFKLTQSYQRFRKDSRSSSSYSRNDWPALRRAFQHFLSGSTSSVFPQMPWSQTSMGLWANIRGSVTENETKILLQVPFKVSGERQRRQKRPSEGFPTALDGLTFSNENLDRFHLSTLTRGEDLDSSLWLGLGGGWIEFSFMFARSSMRQSEGENSAFLIFWFLFGSRSLPKVKPN